MATKRLSTIITIGGAISASLVGATTKAKGQLNEIGNAVKTLAREQRDLEKQLRNLSLDGMANASQLRSRHAAVTNELERQRAALDRLKRLEDARQSNMDNRARLRGKIGDTMAFGAAVMLPSALAVRQSSDFNYQLQVIGNTADMTREQIAGLGTEIMRISDETGQSAQTTQTAIGFLVAAGMQLGTARASMRSIGRTATATASEIEDVSRAAFVLNDTLAIAPDGMQSALDILVQAGKEGNFEFRAMAANIPQLGASFRALKMTGAEAVGTMGAALQIARKGAGDEAEAANNLRNFLAKVLSPDTLRKAERLGSDLYGIISGAQARGENPFEAAIQEINRITQGGDQKLLGELFQDMQVQNFLRPMLQNLEEYDRIKRAALGGTGVVDRDFVRMSETTKQEWNEMANAASRMSLAVGGSLEPAVGRLFRTLRPAVNTITDFVNENPKLVSGTIMVVGGLTALRLGALVTGYAFTFLKGGLLTTVGLLYRVGPAAVAAGTATGAAAAGPTLLGRAMLFAGKGVLWLGRALLMNPIGLAVTAIGTAVFLVYKYWEPLKGFFTGLWADITATARGAFDWILGKLDAIGSGWQRTKEFLGFGTDQPAAGSPAASSAAAGGTNLQLPQMATGRGSSQSVTNTQHNTITIHQQPGQDANALAQEVMRKLDQRNAVRGRSMMFDPVMP